ncbi:MAG: hypothetical protein ACE5HY_05220 [Candidatus Hydrothermarchaeales archaeon]
MKKWSFIIDVEDWNKLQSIVEKTSKAGVNALGGVGSENALYKVTTTFYQKKDRWLQPEKPRQDIGTDLDNLLKQVFDGLGPIIGYRRDYTGKRAHGGVRDSSIIEVHAKKVNSGSEKEFLGVEIEVMYESKKEA